jgi:hypothetical protein
MDLSCRPHAEKNAEKNKKSFLIFMSIMVIIPNVAVAETAAGKRKNRKSKKLKKLLDKC